MRRANTTQSHKYTCASVKRTYTQIPAACCTYTWIRERDNTDTHSKGSHNINVVKSFTSSTHLAECVRVCLSRNRISIRGFPLRQNICLTHTYACAYYNQTRSGLCGSTQSNSRFSIVYCRAVCECSVMHICGNV